MPSPRAVLCDIVERGLDPTRAHRRTATDGRLAGHAKEEPHKEESLKLALKKLPQTEDDTEKKTESVKEEPPAVEKKAPDEPKKVAEAAPQVKPGKKEKVPKEKAPVPAAETEEVKKD